MGDIVLPVTLTTAAGLALINVWLQLRIGQVRSAEKIFIGDGGSEPVIRRMRAQANLVENAPFVLALILAIELARGTTIWLWVVGAVFLVARVLHPFGMDGVRACRALGTGATMLLLAGLAVYAAYIGLQGHPPLVPLTLSPAG